MNDTAVVLLAVLCALLLASLAFTVGLLVSRNVVFPEGPPKGEYDDFEDDEEDEVPALKIDPENPPTWKVYKGPGGPLCTCHDRPIEFGENILMWPDPEEGGYRLFHEGFVKGMVPPRA